jgi:ATP diphosphatase
MRPLPLNRDASDRLVHDRTAGLERLAEIMRRLRAPEGGCPWDLEQDFASIAPYTLEEAHEVADAIGRGAWDELRLELGDLLLQVIYHSQMAEEAGLFSLEEVIEGICGKMIARHPHVFGEETVTSAGDQVQRWENAKAKERAGRVLGGIALALPALTRAVKLQNRAARVGFDWPEVRPVAEKIAEEAQELAAARDSAAPDQIAEEYGDMLFAMANLARHFGLDPEAALRAANAKFTRRFGFIEDRLAAEGRDFAEVSLDEMEAIWAEAKLAQAGSA